MVNSGISGICSGTSEPAMTTTSRGRRSRYRNRDSPNAVVAEISSPSGTLIRQTIALLTR